MGTRLRPALARTAVGAGLAAALVWAGSTGSTAHGPQRGAGQDAPPTAARDAFAAWLDARPPEPDVICGTPALTARQMRFRLPQFPLPHMAAEDVEEPPDGQPLWFDPEPRLIRADSREGLTLRYFTIVGDFETLEFDRWSRDAGEVLTETWTRTEARNFRGQLTSIFNPTWTEAELWDAIGSRRRGPDSPVAYLGTLKIPVAGGDEEEEDDPSAEDPDEDAGENFDRVHIQLPVAPLNLPVSRIERIDHSVQYASHVVNIVLPGFGGDRVGGDDYALNLEDVTEHFYRYFPDIYDSIAVVTAEQHPTAEYGAFHWNARNPIGGLGLEDYDYTDYFGSAGALRSVEFYTDADFTTMWTSNHEIGHQWSDFWDWEAITGGIDFAGWNPSGHMPLLFPGESLLGAVLRSIRRVGWADGVMDEEGGGASSYVIERTPAPSMYHPTTLYRMGLIGPEEVPEMVIFEDQGQFDDESSSAPEIGSAVEGVARPVHINDIIAEHGTRTGPVDSSWRRATVVVSRSALIPAEEMHYWNFFSARHAARSGVTTFGGMPGFHEATGGRAELITKIERAAGYNIVNEPPLQVSNVPIHPGEFRGVRLDRPLPGAMTPGTRMTFSGRVVSADAADVVEVCVEHTYVGPPDDEHEDFRAEIACDRPAGNRFSMPLRFDLPGRYGVEVLLRHRGDAPDARGASLGWMTGITVQ